MDFDFDGIIDDFGSMKLSSSGPDIADTSSKSPSTQALPNATTLLTLPNEVLDQIAGHISPSRLIRENDGNRPHEWVDQDTQLNASLVRQEHYRCIGSLRNLALTCRRLAPAAQNALLDSVSLLQPSVTASREVKTRTSSLAHFLRTLIERPDLRVRVFSLAVYFAKNEPIASVEDPEEDSLPVCRTCFRPLLELTDKLPLLPDDKPKWIEELKSPSGAIVCGLVLAALPNLRSLELYERPGVRAVKYSSTWNGRKYVNRVRLDHSSLASDVALTNTNRLSRALAITRIEKLSLSTRLNGLILSHVSTLSSLTLDFEGVNRLSIVTRKPMLNVTHLKLVSTCLEPDDTKLFPLLFRGLPNIQTLELDRGLPSLQRSYSIQWEEIRDGKICHFPVPARVQTIVLRGANHHDIKWVRDMLQDSKDPFTGRRIELHWQEHQRVPLEFSQLVHLAQTHNVQIAVYAKEVFIGFETVGRETAFDRRKFKPCSVGKNLVKDFGAHGEGLWRKA